MTTMSLKTSFFLNCDSAYQIRDFITATKYALPPPLEPECPYLQRRFDIQRRDVPQLPENCVEKTYLYKTATGKWHKCCTEVLGLSGLVDTRAHMVCQQIEAIGTGVRIPNTALSRDARWQCFRTRPPNRTTLGYTEDPSCFCPEGRNGSCWCPDAKTECVPFGKHGKALSESKNFSVYSIP